MGTTFKTFCREARVSLIEAHSNIHQIIRELREIEGNLDPCHLQQKLHAESLIKELQDISHTLIAFQIELSEYFPRVINEGKFVLCGMDVDLVTKKIIPFSGLLPSTPKIPGPIEKELETVDQE